MEPWQPNLEPWKTMNTDLEVEVEVDLRQLGKVLIFRDTQTDRSFLLYIDPFLARSFSYLTNPKIDQASQMILIWYYQYVFKNSLKPTKWWVRSLWRNFWRRQHWQRGRGRRWWGQPREQCHLTLLYFSSNLKNTNTNLLWYQESPRATRASRCPGSASSNDRGAVRPATYCYFSS